jgi:5-methylcytosine-specific restriction protein B
MSLDLLVQIVLNGEQANWSARNKAAFEALFGAPEGRYPKAAQKSVVLRAPDMGPESGVPFAAYIHPSNPSSGPYSGFSFVIFPVPGEWCLVGLGVGTQGLTPDEAILGRPGHSRKVRAICEWLNRDFGDGEQIAWAKQDPTRTDIGVPEVLRQKWSSYKSVFDRYGKEMYALFKPPKAPEAAMKATSAFLDLLFEERGYEPNAKYQPDRENIRSSWFDCLMPSVAEEEVRDLLKLRRYVIIQGPPGTGKTRMALELLRTAYGEFGRSVQFHPNTTYEIFIGGLAPMTSGTELGLQFRPKPGVLMEAAAEAITKPSKPYLLHIDEINRADLAKILGEAIFLLEAGSEFKRHHGGDVTEPQRQLELPYDFGKPYHRTFFLPANLHIIGTMNSADRSIAIVDIAVRRRFAFLSLWPQMSVVVRNGCELMQKAFRDLVTIFVEHAGDDVFNLVPGHSYFLESHEEVAKKRLKTNLAPLLEEYLTQGYVGGFAEPIRGYLQWLNSL